MEGNHYVQDGSYVKSLDYGEPGIMAIFRDVLSLRRDDAFCELGQ